jgi:hypothetical protein
MNIAYDKLFHFWFCAGVAILLSFALSPLWVFGITMGIGVAKEVRDAMGYGTPEWLDLLADLLGTLFGLGVYACIRLFV